MAGRRALLNPGTDSSTYHADFGKSVTNPSDARRLGYVSGIWIGPPPPTRRPRPVSIYGGTGFPVPKA